MSESIEMTYYSNEKGFPGCDANVGPFLSTHQLKRHFIFTLLVKSRHIQGTWVFDGFFLTVSHLFNNIFPFLNIGCIRFKSEDGRR